MSMDIKNLFSRTAATAIVCAAAFFWQPGLTAASNFNYDNLTNVFLSGSGITLTILPGSQAEAVTIGSSSLTISLADGELFMLRYPGPRPGKLVNNGGVTECNLVAGSNEIAMVGPTSTPVVFTPVRDECTAAQSAGGDSAAMALIQPNGGESWGPGAAQPIIWSSSGDVASVRLKLSVDGGGSYDSVIAAGLANSGVYGWTPPDWRTARARVKIEALNAAGTVIGEDASDACFALTGSVIKDSGSCSEAGPPSSGDTPPSSGTPPAAENPPATDSGPQTPAADGGAQPPAADEPTSPTLPELPTPPEPPSVPPPFVDPSSSGSYEPSVAAASTPNIDVDKGYAPGGTVVPCLAGSLIKLPDDGDPKTTGDKAVYYCGADGKRHAFPNERVFFSWFKDFSGVTIVSPAAMAAIPLGANVTYRPGKKMIKVVTDPKVYAVSRGGLLRWVTSEAVAVALYGSDWKRMIDDVPDSLFADYQVGEPITLP